MNRAFVRRQRFVAGVGAALTMPAARPRAALAGIDGEDPFTLVPVLVSEDGVLRTTTCLRPYRPDGFVLRREQVGAKTLVHNYGHGGGGVTLSWGVASMAVDLVGDAPSKIAAVVGAGAVGLATARVLQDRGFRVAIYADKPPLATTSSHAGAQWSPVTTVDSDRRTPVYTAMLVEASRRAYQAFADLVSDEYGVRWIENYALSDDPTDSPVDHFRALGMGDLYPNVRVYGPGEHPFPTKYAVRLATMMIDPPVYLTAVLRDVLERGSTLTIRSFTSATDMLASLAEPIVFNCTGLGARALFGDDGMMPMKGQLSVLLPQRDVDYITLGPGDLYMFPRPDGIVLGGTHERNVWSLEPDSVAETRIVAAHAAFFNAMRRPRAAAGG